MNKLTTITRLKFLIWLAYYQKIFLICFTINHQISKILNYVLKIIFTIFNYVGPLISSSSTSNNFDFNRYNRKKDENFSSIKKLLLNVKKVQQLQQISLRLYEAKNMNTDNANSVYFRNDNSISKSSGKYYSFDLLWISVTGLKVEYNS